MRYALLLLMVLLCLLPLRAQSNTCGVVAALQLPVDSTIFTVVQAFAAPNPRHEGQFHTGEDWYGGRGTTLGQPVRAAARGQVTYARPDGWGADGGVVIVEHRLEDERRVYTVYGHLQSTPTMPFPERLTCVEAGQIIGAVGDARPAPHLHFEVRTMDADVPGPGYSAVDPLAAGWLHPSQFILTQQAALNPAFAWALTVDGDRWRAQRGPAAPPLVLNDNSLLYLDGSGTTLRRATADGRILWRVAVNPAVSVSALRGQALITYADGSLNPLLDYDSGRQGEGWRLNTSFTGAPIPAFDWLLYPAAADRLVAVDADRRNILWQMDAIPPPVRWQVAGDGMNFIVGLLTADHEVIVISGSGGLIDRKTLRQPGALAAAPDGTLLVYSQGGLWRVGLDGLWSLYLPAAPVSSASRALLTTAGGRLFVFDGGTLHAYAPDLTLLWSTPIGVPVEGRTELALYETTLLLLSSGGTLAVLNDGGQVCNRMQLYGAGGPRLWHALGTDNVLRLALADTFYGLDWPRLTAGCR
ncbi:MAG: peptidoglycan DD-metalloendopeptidase family protein [Anaerolineae bacterium]|jgi:murein DD-endopeptidase MepM/ murein hydrolase activator NlpD|nr:peptidoglycan DD-metalloendopeptidase family protein [Anaerolineae bacterium]